MYHLRSYNLEQNNIATKLSGKPGMAISIHWLNPLLHKCDKQLYRDAWRAVKQSGASRPDKVS